MELLDRNGPTLARSAGTSAACPVGAVGPAGGRVGAVGPAGGRVGAVGPAGGRVGAVGPAGGRVGAVGPAGGRVGAVGIPGWLSRCLRRRRVAERVRVPSRRPGGRCDGYVMVECCPGSRADVVWGTGSYVGSKASLVTPGHHLHPRKA